MLMVFVDDNSIYNFQSHLFEERHSRNERCLKHRMCSKIIHHVSSSDDCSKALLGNPDVAWSGCD